MKRNILLTLLFCCSAVAAQQNIAPRIETCPCNFKVDTAFTRLFPRDQQTGFEFKITQDSTLRTECGYLIVPENRKRKSSQWVKLPFVILKSPNTRKREDPFLFTSGGPGNSSLGWINGARARGLAEERDVIAFEQRGTRFAWPYLRSLVLDSVMRIAYRKNLDKDSMWMVGVKLYKQDLLARGIDIAGYSSDETISDLGDLLALLKIDSVNLHGGSYSGGLMAGVLQRYPSRVRSLILDSPLPLFSPIDEDEHRHFLEAFRVYCSFVKSDSTDEKYADLENRFHSYFNSIRDKKFTLSMIDPVTREPLNVVYTKNELLDEVVGTLLDGSRIPKVAEVVYNIINGEHRQYVQPKIERVLSRLPHPDGMRMLVYCADQAAYHDENVIRQLFDLYPYMEGYHINDVWKPVCDCWSVPPLAPATKQHFYSAVPALLVDGIMDAACSPRYIIEMKHYMPNAQAFLFNRKSHGVDGKTFRDMEKQFLSNPFSAIKVTDPEVSRLLR